MLVKLEDSTAAWSEDLRVHLLFIIISIIIIFLQHTLDQQTPEFKVKGDKSEVIDFIFEIPSKHAH